MSGMAEIFRRYFFPLLLTAADIFSLSLSEKKLRDTVSGRWYIRGLRFSHKSRLADSIGRLTRLDVLGIGESVSHDGVGTSFAENM